MAWRETICHHLYTLILVKHQQKQENMNYLSVQFKSVLIDVHVLCWVLQRDIWSLWLEQAQGPALVSSNPHPTSHWRNAQPPCHLYYLTCPPSEVTRFQEAKIKQSLTSFLKQMFTPTSTLPFRYADGAMLQCHFNTYWSWCRSSYKVKYNCLTLHNYGTPLYK